jgi:hypothetical protein
MVQPPIRILAALANMVGVPGQTQPPLLNTSLGAPECYRYDDFVEGTAIDVKQTIDVWSLGCVLSEVAVWVVHGRDRLEAYRQKRLEETRKLGDFRDGRAFHDGESVLQSVGSIHDEVFENVRQSDYITKSVVKKMITEMLDEVDGRPNAKQLWLKSRHIIKDAEKNLKASRGIVPQTDSQPRRSAPPVLPPEPLSSQVHQPGPNRVLGRWSSVKEDRDRRSSTFNVLAREQSPPSEPNADDGYETPEEHGNPNPPTTPPFTNATSQNESRAPFAYGSLRQSRTPRQHAETNDSVAPWSHSPTRYDTPHRHTINRHSNHTPNCVYQDGLSSPMSGSNIKPMDESLPGQTLAEDASTLPVTTNPFTSQHFQKMAPFPTAQQDRQNAAKPLPKTSVAIVENWILKKQRGASDGPLKHKEHLDYLMERDHVRYTPFRSIKLF